MAKVLGIGGVFFKSPDREALLKWYEDHLGMAATEHGSVDFRASELPSAGYMVWSPFVAETTYFKPSGKDFMINLMVDDLEGVLRRIEAGGGRIVGEVEEYDFGRFGWFIDPDDNKVELWEPQQPD